MPVPKRKMSKMKSRQRKAANRYEAPQTAECPACHAPVIPHRVCGACGIYKKQQVITVSE